MSERESGDEGVDGGASREGGRGLLSAELSALLAGAPFLDELAPEIIADFAAACETVRVAGDSLVVRRELPSDSFYIVVHGALRTMARGADDCELVISESHRGEGVGLPALLGHVSAPVDVYAIRDSVLLRLTRDRFARLAARHPQLASVLAEGLARQALRLIGAQHEWATWMRPGAIAQNIALLLPSSDSYFAPAAVRLARAALERYRHIAHVSPKVIDKALGRGAAGVLARSDPRSERVSAFLQSLEPGHEIVLYECDTTLPAWCERCVRQADRLLVIVRADRPEHRAEVNALLTRALQRRQLPQIDIALVHEEHAEVAQGAAEWERLEGRARIHHVRMGDRADYERVARTIVRSGVGLVLSGGGARGIAHVGVLKALEEAQVPIDHLGGTSMGAIVAAAYARGWRADEIMERIRDLFKSRTALYDPALPFEALLQGHKLERVLQEYYGEIDIEDLWLPFFCVSTNLANAARRVHDRGRLWRAVAASCSIPGIFPPRREDGELLVDGGVVDNLPIDVMADHFQGAIIASDVNLYGEATPAPSQKSLTARVRELVRWLNPFSSSGGHSPEIFEILMRSALVGSQQAALTSLARGDASLYLPLPVERFRVLDWGAHDRLFTIGYEFAQKQLATWSPPPSRT